MKPHILVVDDEEEIREMLSRHFQFKGYSVETAENGEDALKKMQDKKTDIVVSDIRMPVMDGTDLCKQIKKDFPMTRVIMISGFVTLENALACLRRGADNCLFKPLNDLTELDRAVENSLGTIKRWIEVLSDLRKMKSGGRSGNV